MEKNIKISLSTKDLNNLIKDLKKLSISFKNLNAEVSKELAYQTASELEKNYNSISFESSDGKANIGVENNNNTYKVFARSKGVIYEEFGTGDIGMASPHPISQSKFGLKDYNTGQTIREADEKSAKNGITSGMYWTYWDGNKLVYTQGIPSGKFMFNTSEWLRNNRKKIIQEKVDDVISKV